MNADEVVLKADEVVTITREEKVEEREVVQTQSFDTLRVDAESLLVEANTLLGKPDRDPAQVQSLKDSLVSLISSMTAGLTGETAAEAGVVPELLEQLTQALPQLSNPPILMSPIEEITGLKNDNPHEWLETESRLSESMLWRLQEEYYSSQGIAAWNMVPFFVTSSTFIAESYAEMIIAFLKDYRDKLNVDEPIYIVEMATGSGRFSQYLIREILTKKEYFASLRDLKIRYIMTDFTENNIEFWESHERFKPLVEQGVLDFAIYRPEEYQFLQLRHSKVKVSNKTVKNPILAIANYFFDTIRQDSFQIDEGVLKEGRINLWRNFNENVKPGDPVRVGQLTYNYNYKAIDENYYPDPIMNEMLKFYRENYYKATIIFPLGAIDCIKNLLHMSNDNLVLISSDKGFTDMEYMVGYRDSEYAIHDGAFSYMVNYHAIRKYFELRGGTSFYTTDKNLDLNTQVSILTQDKTQTFEHLDYYRNEKMDRFNPINYLYSVQSLFAEDNKERPTQRLSGLLAFFRLNLCDPSTFCRFASQLFDVLDNITFVQKVDLLKILDKTWENYYHFGGESNLPFWIAQTLFGLGMYDKSLAFFEKTNELHDPHEVVDYFMAKSYENLGKLYEAKEMYERCLSRNPEFLPARESLKDIEIVLRERKSVSDILRL